MVNKEVSASVAKAKTGSLIRQLEQFIGHLNSLQNDFELFSEDFGNQRKAIISLIQDAINFLNTQPEKNYFNTFNKLISIRTLIEHLIIDYRIQSQVKSLALDSFYTDLNELHLLICELIDLLIEIQRKYEEATT